MKDGAYPDNWRDKLDEEPRDLEQRWVEMVEVVDEQPLDMRAIVVLCGAFSAARRVKYR